MRVRAALSSLVLVLASAVVSHAAPGGPAGGVGLDAPIDLPDAPMVLDARPSSVQLSQSVNFDQHGNVNNEHNNLSINLNIFYDGAIQPMAYGDLKLTRAVTSSGEELRFDPNQNHRGARRIHQNRHHNGEPFFNSYFNLPVPQRPCKSIRLIEGEMTLTLPQGEVKQATLGPWSKFVDQRVRITNTPGSLVILRKEANGRIKVEFNRELDPLITEIVFVDGKNVPIQARQQGSGSGGAMAYRYFGVDVPDDGKVWVRLYPETREQRAKFVARDVPMPGGAGGEPVFELAVEAVDLEQANAEAGPEAVAVEIIGEAEH